MKCRVLEKSFINGKIEEPGSIVDYDLGPGGKLSSNLESIEEEVKEAPKPVQANGKQKPAPSDQ